MKSIKSIKIEVYSIDDVKGLHVVNAQVATSTHVIGDIKDKYVIMYLKDRDFDLNARRGSVNFYRWNRKHILFKTVYDEKV